jgi:hypothetical protein
MEIYSSFGLLPPRMMAIHTRVLGKGVTKHDKDGPAVMRNLARARAKWASMKRFLVRDATLYKSIIAI